jgi:ubiquinone/menaquinone biosynthesis C-methylase UbiE
MSYSNPAAYEQFMGRWSARLAPLFLRFVGLTDGQHVLDVGCGTGTLARAMTSSGLTVAVTGVDPVAAYVSFARNAVPDADFCPGNAEALPFPDDAFDAAVGLLVLQDFIDAQRAVREMARVTRRGGVVATSMWDFQDGLPMLAVFWHAAEAVAAEQVSSRRRQNPRSRHATLDDLESLWRDSGLSDVETTTLEISMDFSSFDDYWQPFLGASTPTSAFAAAIDRQTDGALARAVRNKLAGVRPGGSFVLPARAWAIKGTVGSRGHG